MWAELKTSCRFKADGTIVDTVQKSWRRIYRTNKRVRELCSYSWLLKKVRRGKANVVRGRKRTDVCHICYSFDQQASKIIEACYSKTEEAVKSLDPDYFRGFKAEKTDDYVSSAKYARAFKDYVSSHEGNFIYDRLRLSEVEREKLSDVERRFLEYFTNDVLPIIVLYGKHFLARDHQWAALQKHRWYPEPGATYIIMDYEDRLGNQVGFSLFLRPPRVVGTKVLGCECVFHVFYDLHRWFLGWRHLRYAY